MRLAPMITCVLALPALALVPATPARAQTPDTTPADTPADATSAEHQRLSAEMARLAQKNAWDGVERSYQRMLQLGMEPTFDDLVLAAEAARHRGAVATARERLITASAIRSSDDVAASVAAIDEGYGAVVLEVDAGAGGLVADEPSFRPDRRAAIAHARERLEETGSFEGYLPTGAYTLGDRAFEVRAGQPTTRIVASAPARPPVADAGGLAHWFQVQLGPGAVQQAESGVHDSFGIHAAAATALPASLRLAGAYQHRVQRQAYLSRNTDPTTGGPQRLRVHEQVIDARIGVDWDAATGPPSSPTSTATTSCAPRSATVPGGRASPTPR